jgi:hypothetical protein
VQIAVLKNAFDREGGIADEFIEGVGTTALCRLRYFVTSFLQYEVLTPA